jgi:hypothetical protein
MGKLFDALPESFMKKVLADENTEIVENLLLIKEQFEKEQDKDRKVVFKERLTSAFWNLYTAIGQRLTEKSPKEKRLFLRFGILDMKYLTQDEQKLILSQPFETKDAEDTIFYMDEWLIGILKGQLKPSVTDEAAGRKSSKSGSVDSAQQSKFERVTGLIEANKKNYLNIVERRKLQEDAMTSLMAMVSSHPMDPLFNATDVYNEDQIKKMDEITEIVRELKRIDKELNVTKKAFYENYEEMKELESSLMETKGPQETTGYAVDSHTAESEIGALRQMVKMCIGRQGNHFPILLSSFIPKESRDYNFKAPAYEKLKEIEQMDYTIFERTFRQQTHRIPPYIILTPGYGNYGICWEPYDKYNKASSKGRIAVPIFSRNPKMSLIIALGDFRWQVAKEMAGYHWMDEGLTARYYTYLDSNKIKGDIKTHFINDYMLWMIKEAAGIQKLDNQDVRYIFWRFIPFPDKLKEELSSHGFYYNDLYKKELSFRMSKEL